MSATQQPSVHTTNGPAAQLGVWRDHARLFLQPIAAPSILGLYGFSVATFMVTAHLVGGTTSSPLLIFPFATAAGGIAQGAAALWAYKARDGLATAIHGVWSAFWLGYGFLTARARRTWPTSRPSASRSPLWANGWRAWRLNAPHPPWL